MMNWPKESADSYDENDGSSIKFRSYLIIIRETWQTGWIPLLRENIRNFDYEELTDNFEAGRCEACGAGTIIAMMKSADKLNYHNSMVLYRNNSGDTTGDKRGSCRVPFSGSLRRLIAQ